MKRRFIRIKTLPPDTDRKWFYNHADVVPNHVYRALSLTTHNAVEVQLGQSVHFLPERCYEWVDDE